VAYFAAADGPWRRGPSGAAALADRSVVDRSVAGRSAAGFARTAAVAAGRPAVRPKRSVVQTGQTGRIAPAVPAALVDPAVLVDLAGPAAGTARPSASARDRGAAARLRGAAFPAASAAVRVAGDCSVAVARVPAGGAQGRPVSSWHRRPSAAAVPRRNRRWSRTDSCPY